MRELLTCWFLLHKLQVVFESLPQWLDIIHNIIIIATYIGNLIPVKVFFVSKFIPTFIEPGRLFTQMSVVSICKIHKFIKKEKAVQFYRFVPHLKGFHRVAHSKFSSSSLPPPPPLSNYLSVTGISLP